VHDLASDLDEGPIIDQDLEASATLHISSESVRDIERRVLARTIAITWRTA
jgi:formyltetrahydrofolate hydrolase